MKEHDTSDPQLPQALIQQLKAQEQRRAQQLDLSVPPEMDQRILDDAHHQLNQPMRTHWYWTATAAAALVIAAVLSCLVLPTHLSMSRARRQSPHLAGEQFDLQTPTILPAFQLARALKKQQKIDPQWDVNHDADIDQLDVELLAMRAVELKPENRP